MRKSISSRRCVLFGAAQEGVDFYNESGIRIVCFFDNDEKRWGNLISGVEICKPYYDESLYVIVANLKHDIDMVAQLLELGYRKFSVIRNNPNHSEGKKYAVDDFDYEGYSDADFALNHNKVALIGGKSSGSNAYCFKYMIEHYHKDFPFEMVMIDERHKYAGYYYDVLTSYYLILTGEFTGLKNRVIIQSYYGVKLLKGVGYWDPGISESAFELTHQAALNCTYILASGIFDATMFSSCYGVPQNRFRYIGVPRNDVLQLSNGREKMERLLPQTKGKTIILYMPTYRDQRRHSAEEMESYIFDYDGFEKTQFDSFLSKNNCYMVVKMHIADSARFQWLSREMKNVYVFYDEDFGEDDFYGYINAADYLITDYSSVYGDYILLDRPIIFAQRDYTKYRDELRLMYDNLPFWCPGRIIYSLNELYEELKRLKNGEDEYQEERRRFRDLLYQHKDTKATDRLITLMMENR